MLSIDNGDHSSPLHDFKVGKVETEGETEAQTEAEASTATVPTLDDVYETLRARPDDAGQTNQIGGAQPPAYLVNRCRTSIAAEPACGVVLSIDDGALEPRRYSDEELAAAVAAAGYLWAPAPDAH